MTLLADRMWLLLGGRIEPVRRTGEKRYFHDQFAHPLRTNGRRNDVPAKLLSRLNQLLKATAANEPAWSAERPSPAPRLRGRPDSVRRDSCIVDRYTNVTAGNNPHDCRKVRLDELQGVPEVQGLARDSRGP